ncbi:erythromycin esterase family protein [Microtetraspora malaysiensis]|uniref:Erythromycin esterase family protein n=1 Tax=Microtetraspora malaysiensis TaxID=161358 RepID=A0ABW6T3W4_9ACTN
MSLHLSVRDIGLHFGDDTAQLGIALARFLTTLDRPPLLLALGEPTHGVEMFPRLRNQMLAYLVEHHGFRSVAVESDCVAALAVDDHVTTGRGDVDEVLARGFSHGFGASPANRELVMWLRDHNAGSDPSRHVRFYGFDAPLEMSGAPSPRACLLTAHAYLTEHLGGGRVPHEGRALDALLGDDDAWANPEAIMNASRSVGDTREARTLRLMADDVIALFEVEAPGLRAATSDTDFERASMFARTAQGLLRYHAAMASSSPGRVEHMLGLRDAMMAANLLAVARAEADRGPCLVFAHNAHLQRHRSQWELAGMDLRWWSAGAITATALRDRYIFIASDFGDATSSAASQADPDNLQTVLSHATPDRAIFPAQPLSAALGRHPRLRARADADPGYFPLDPGLLDGMDAVAFIKIAERAPA